MLKRIALLILMAIPAMGQLVDDGHLKFNFSGVIGGFFLLGGPGEAPEKSVNFATCCGKFYVSLAPQSQDFSFYSFASQDGYSGTHSVRFKTGPILNQVAPYNYSQGAQFGPGGQLDLISGDASFLPCINTVCTYSGRWLWSAITVLSQPDGSRIYRFEGMLNGTYTDQRTFRHHVLAHYQQESLAWVNLLGIDDGSQQSWGIGSLQVILSTQGKP